MESKVGYKSKDERGRGVTICDSKTLHILGKDKVSNDIASIFNVQFAKGLN